MRFYELIVLLMIFLPFMVYAQEVNTYNMYTLNKDSFLLLPHFNTSAIANSDIENIILSLYVLDIKSTERNAEMQFTVNPINLESRQKSDGVSIFRTPRVNEYFDISLPRELFKKMIGTNDRILLKVVDPDTSIAFAGINNATTDPKLTIVEAGVRNPNIPNISLDGIGQINNSQIIINTGSGTVNSYSSDRLSWWLTYILFPLIVAIVAGYLIFKFGWNR